MQLAALQNPKKKVDSNSQSRTKKEIIKWAALQCFLKFGFRGTTIAEVARVSKTSKPLVLYHYKITDEILFELMNDWATSGKTTTTNLLHDKLGQSPDELILAILDATILWMREHSQMAQLTPILFQASAEIPDVKNFLFEVFESGRKRIELLLGQIPHFSKMSKKDLKSAAQSIHCLIFGTSLYVLSQGTELMMDSTHAFNRRMIKNFIAKA